VIRPDRTLADPDFINFAVSSPEFVDRVARHQRGTGYPAVSDRDVLAEVIRLPPLPEQRAIAHVLRTVQRAKEATEQVIAAARALKASLVSEYVTREEPPETWSTKAIGDVASRVEYGISKRGGRVGRYPILRMNNISDGRIVAEDLQWVDLTDEEFRRFKLGRGDVLFNRTNSIDKVGKSAYFDLDGDWVFASYLLRVSVDEAALDPRFLNDFLGAPSTQATLRGLATRAVSQANINATKLKDLAVSFPSLPEQREIADAIQAVDAKFDAEVARYEALAALFDSLLHDLMSASLRVADLTPEVD
jgi:type I restriction enzyme S subunit